MLQTIQKHVLNHRLFTTRTLFSTGLLIALLSLGLVACNASSGQGNSTPTATSTPSSQVQDCGRVQFLNAHLTGDRQAAMQAENCFLQAFQQCHPAKLVFAINGLDTGSTHTFTIANNNGACSISDATAHFIAPRPAQQGPTYTCASVKQVSEGLLFSNCGGENDVIVPTP